MITNEGCHGVDYTTEYSDRSASEVLGTLQRSEADKKPSPKKKYGPCFAFFYRGGQKDEWIPGVVTAFVVH
ncbi:hypothetical protein RRG08_063106 [Elysia crispata]|uniref:Uncharacterized protein n=1 Tax=Elysia crispata TaxID=231223 RepID=A0AAE0YFZ5_9GAST|nr:hypothetical protein RRG08_063106 [Elysia crispata]